MSKEREEELYHESARELARMVVELEGTLISLSEQLGETREVVTQLSGENAYLSRRETALMEQVRTPGSVMDWVRDIASAAETQGRLAQTEALTVIKGLV